MDNLKDNAAAFIGAAVIALGVMGWILNIIKLVAASSIDGLEFVRFAGIFVVPVGAVVGWLF